MIGRSLENVVGDKGQLFKSSYSTVQGRKDFPASLQAQRAVSKWNRLFTVSLIKWCWYSDG